MENTWQIPPLCHLLLIGSFVLDGTDNMHLSSQPRRCFNTRQKASRVLQKHVGNGAIQASSEQDVNFHLRGLKCTHFGFQSATHYAGRTTKSASRLVKGQSVAQVTTMTVKNQHNQEAGQQKLGIDPRIVTLINEWCKKSEREGSRWAAEKQG